MSWWKSKVSSGNCAGVLYFYVHFVTEVLCFYFLSQAIGDNLILWLVPFMYDGLAFVPQMLFGAISDRFEKIPFGLIGIALMVVGLMLFNVAPVLLVTVLIAIGNACVHVNGAEVTLRSSKGKITPAAVFVSGGSFGVITGKLLADYVSVWPIILLAVTAIPVIVMAEKYRVETKHLKMPCRDFKTANLGLPIWLITLGAVFVVMVRGFVGYSIPTAWNKTVFQTVMLFVFMGVGKALGGILVDRIGIRKTTFISMIGAIPFLVFGNELMMVSLVGVMFFSMTMAITLSILVSVYRKNPGLAFGLTTVGLALGVLPIFFFRITELWINDIIVVVASVICFYVLLKITKKEVKNV